MAGRVLGTQVPSVSYPDLQASSWDCHASDLSLQQGLEYQCWSWHCSALVLSHFLRDYHQVCSAAHSPCPISQSFCGSEIWEQCSGVVHAQGPSKA
jgi:hypothetical protein